MRRFALAAALLAASAAGAQERTCQTIGNFVYCSDGTVVQQIGNMTYITPPRPAEQPYQLPPPGVVMPSQADTRIPLMVNPPPQIGRQCGYLPNGQYVCR